ncbi:MAG: oxalurate catabolism protein HpxZ [Rhodospirillales bacterium]
MNDLLEMDIPEILAEVTTAFKRYEVALKTNDVEVLGELFKNAPYTLRFGMAENLYGFDEIEAFRKARPSDGLERTLQNTKIITFGENMGIATTEFRRAAEDRIGRQSQAWVRQPEGWRIVSAHVSWMDMPS